MKFIQLSKALAKFLHLLSLTFVLIVVSVLLVIPITVLLLYRKIISQYALHFKKDLSKMLTSGAHIFAADDMAHRPNVNVVVTFVYKGPLAVPELRKIFQERIIELKAEGQGQGSGSQLLYPELQQYYHQWGGFLFWKKDSNFNLEDHIRTYDYNDLDNNEEGNVGFEDLNRLKANLLKKGWPENKSPWEFLVIQDYQDAPDSEFNEKCVEKGTVCFFRFHHGIGDGLGFFNLLWNRLTKGEPLERTEDLQQLKLKKALTQRRSLLYYLSLPFRIHFEYAQQIAGSNDTNEWKVEPERLTGTVKSAVTGRISMENLMEVRRTFKASFSGLLMSLISGALRKCMIASGVDLTDVPNTLHALLPIPSRFEERGKLRNHITYLYPTLPLSICDLPVRLKACESNLKQLKRSTVPLMNSFLHRLAGSFPVSVVKALHKNVLATVLISNFPGPMQQTCMLGQPMTDVTFSTSCHGNNGICISIISYDADLRISIEVDNGIPSKSGNLAEEIAASIEGELNDYLNYCDGVERFA